MNYKILCSDLDGTLLSTKSDVSDFAVSEISRIKNTTKIILVSARMPRSMTYLQRRLGIEDQPIICYNGALVLSRSEAVSSTIIPISLVRKICEIAKVLFIKPGLYHSNEWYVEENTERVRKEIRYTQSTPVFRPTEETLYDWATRGLGAHKIMLMGTQTSADTLYPKLQKMMAEEIHLYRSNDTLIELAPKSVSKLSGIQQLLNENESLKDVIAFGDNYNDIDMLSNVGCGVAVSNARDEVKAIANHVTLNNTEDGVAHFIREHL